MIAVVGLSHRTAPIEIREQFALDEAAAEGLARRMVGEAGVPEVLLIATCNRVEAVLASPTDESLAGCVERSLGLLLGGRTNLRPHFYVHNGLCALRHLCRVASSLDSLVIGEPQILGQVRDAFGKARAAGTIGPEVAAAVTLALRVAKRVRTETMVGAGQVSVASVALELARQIFDQLSGRRVALVGTGEMGMTIAELMHKAGAQLIILGRNTATVAELATRFGGEQRALAELARSLVDVDVVVTSTSAPSAIVSRSMVEAGMRARHRRDLFLLDVAVPRDVEPSVDELEGVYLYNIDDLSAIVAQGAAQRRLGQEEAEQLVQSEVDRFEERQGAEQVTPVIRALHRRFGDIISVEVERGLHKKLRGLDATQRQGLEQLLEAATNKILHGPCQALRKAALERPEDLESLLASLVDLFELTIEPEPTQTPAPERSLPPCRFPVTPTPGESGVNAPPDQPGHPGLADEGDA